LSLAAGEADGLQSSLKSEIMSSTAMGSVSVSMKDSMASLWMTLVLVSDLLVS